jgi:hypothetical protein
MHFWVHLQVASGAAAIASGEVSRLQPPRLQELQQILTENGFACAAGGEIAYRDNLDREPCLLKYLPIVKLIPNESGYPVAGGNWIKQ